MATTDAIPGPAALAHRFADALEAKNLREVADLFADDATWDVVGADFLPGGHRFEGREAIIADLLGATVGAQFDLTKPFEIVIEQTHVAGDTAVVEWRVRATSARGAAYENHYCVIFEVAGGRIVAVREYVNTEYAKRVLFD